MPWKSGNSVCKKKLFALPEKNDEFKIVIWIVKNNKQELE